MINLAELDIKRMNHEAQIAHNNRYGWIDDMTIGAREDRTDEVENVVSRLRRMIGHALVFGGNWLEGTPAADPSNPATIGSSVESVR